MFNTNKISLLLALGIVAAATTGDDVGMGAPDLSTDTATPEQIEAARRLDTSVKNFEGQEAMSIFGQSRAFREIMDTQSFKLIQSRDGNPFASFGQYIDERTSKTRPTVSQNIAVVTVFNGISDEELAEAGREKLYVASLMISEGGKTTGKPFATPREALDAARTHTRVELQAMRSNAAVDKVNSVHLLPVKVTLGQQERAEAAWQKFDAVYTEVHGGEGSSMQVSDFFLDVVGGLPLDFLREAAQGQGGAAPVMEGGFTPQDVPIEEVVTFLARNLIAAGRDPQEIIDGLEVALQSEKDRAALDAQERKDREKLEKKDASLKAKNDAKWMTRLSKIKQFQTIDFADGSKVSVADAKNNADTNEFMGVWVKGIHDGTENAFAEESTYYEASKIIAFGIVGINAAPKVEKVKAAAAPKGTKAASEAEAKKTSGKGKPKSDVETSVGISKSQQAGKNKRKPNAIDEGTLPAD